MMYSKKRKCFVAVLCMIIMIYASVIFIPHSHECAGADCLICTLIETSRNTLSGIALFTAVWQLSNFAFMTSATHPITFAGKSGTPVALKVKLSD